MLNTSLAGRVEWNNQANTKSILTPAVTANKTLNYQPQVSFGRALKKDEQKDYQETILSALEALGKKNLALTIHGTSFPSIEKEDPGVGSPNSNGAKKLIKLIELNGFNNLQLGPEGKTKNTDASPYTSTAFSMNPLFIDISELTKPEWSSILDKSTFDDIVNKKPKNEDLNTGSSKTAYAYVYENQENALKEAYKNFKEKIKDENNTIIQSINNKFNAFKVENKSWLDGDALYEALSKEHNNDYFPNWPSEIDKNLFVHLNTPGDAKKEAAKNRKSELEEKYKDETELYKFTQFVADEQKNKMKGFSTQHNIKTISDAQVGFADRDIWVNKNLFLPDWKLGCPPDYFSNEGQSWGFPVLNPDLIFNQDETLGPAGRLLKNRFDRIFEKNPGGVRIDHIIGLIDPWIYQDNQSPKNGARLHSSPEHNKLKQYARAEINDLNYAKPPADNERIRSESLNENKINKYAEIIEKIIIPSALEKGVPLENIVCEDLGTLTNPVTKVMGKLRAKGIGGTSVLQFTSPEPSNPYRMHNIPKENTAAVGNHDTMPTALWAENKDRKQQATHLSYDLIPEEKAYTRRDLFNKLVKDPKQLVKAKFAELFAGPAQNVQIFFTDFFGIKKPYNKPGSSDPDNWLLRLGNNFDKFYYKQLAKNEGINLPEVLNMAIEAKGQKFIDSFKSKKAGNFENINKLVDNLKKYTEILKEPEDDLQKVESEDKAV
ncbi:MAG: hypothetical protein A2104_04025 [Candidatus Melainabacteria bacterium GWF2_32_7]|nr:MAG: hypothetical protein A2104_04025 [Candidatus Melainabacteria bacterium GWF2_32_7]